MVTINRERGGWMHAHTGTNDHHCYLAIVIRQ